MRWPFGPPHMTLKPSQKNKTKKTKQPKKKQTKKNKTTTSNHKTKNKANKTETKARQNKQKQTQETQKHLNLPNPDEQQWATPEKNPKNWEKQAFLTLFWNNTRHTKNKPFNIKTLQQRNPKKKTFFHVQKQPTIFHKFSVFFNIQFLFLKSCVLLKTL